MAIERGYDPAVVVTGGPVTRVGQVSWGAIIAGLIVAFSIQALLALLGLAIGLVTIRPTTEQNPLAGLGMGSLIWWTATTILALLMGGLVAARLAGVPRIVDGVLHGVLTWGLMLILSIVLITTAAGRVISGAAGVFGQGMAYVGQAAYAALPDQLNLPRTGLTENDIRREARELLQQTGQPELQPGRIRAETQEIARTARDAIRTTATQPARARDELDRVVDRFITELQQKGAAVNDEAMINVLVSNTDLSETEAQQTVDRWQAQFARAGEQVEETVEQVTQQTVETAENVAQTMAQAAFWSFVALLVGAGSAAVGGWLGTPTLRSLRPQTGVELENR